MKKLRPVTIREILDQLDRSVFTKHAFNTLFNDEETGSAVEIVHKDHPEYLFKISETYSAWKLIEAPGPRFSDPYESISKDFDSCLNELDGWLNRLLEEISFDFSKSSNFIDQMRVNLERAAGSVPDPDQPFNDTEAVVWNKRLDEIMTRFQDMEEKNEIQRSELDQLKREINEIRSVITKVPKRTWIRSLGNRVLGIAEQALARAGAELAEEQIKKLLSMIDNSD